MTKTENKKLVQGQATGMPLGIVLVWLLNLALPEPVPAEVGAAIGSVVSGLLQRFFGRRHRDEI